MESAAANNIASHGCKKKTHVYQIYTQFRALAVKYVIRITFYWLFCSNNEVKCKQSRSKQWGHPELVCFIPSLISTKSEQLHRECNEVCLCCSKQDLIWHGYQCTPSAQTENMLHLLWTFLHPPFKHKQGNYSHAGAMLGTCFQNVCSMTASSLLSDWHAPLERSLTNIYNHPGFPLTNFESELNWPLLRIHLQCSSFLFTCEMLMLWTSHSIEAPKHV